MQYLLIKDIATVIKRNLRAQRESIIYCEFEVFVGCILADLRKENLLDKQEEKYLRTELLEKD